VKLSQVAELAERYLNEKYNGKYFLVEIKRIKKIPVGALWYDKEFIEQYHQFLGKYKLTIPFWKLSFTDEADLERTLLAIEDNGQIHTVF